MRRESALAQGCAIADGHGGQPVSEGSGGSGHIRPGVKGAWPYAPLPPPSAGGGQNTAACKAEPDHSGFKSTSNPHPID